MERMGKKGRKGTWKWKEGGTSKVLINNRLDAIFDKLCY